MHSIETMRSLQERSEFLERKRAVHRDRESLAAATEMGRIGEVVLVSDSEFRALKRLIGR